MEISIVIVNYNGKNLLKTILPSIKKSTFRDYEVLIVDNNSNDGSREFIRKNYKNVKLVANEKNLGYSGINSALEHCRGKYILFLNNDMELDRNCMANLVKTISSDENTAMAAPRLVNFYDKNIVSGGTWLSRAFYSGHVKGNGAEAKEIPYLGVGLIRKDFVDTFGYLFDPDFFIYAEDVDLGLRIRLNGRKIMFSPKSVICHLHAVTTQKMGGPSTTFLMEKNILTAFFKTLSVNNILLFLPYVLSARLVAICKDLSTLKINNASARLKAVLSIIFNFNLILKKRRQAQKFRRVGDPYVLQVFSEKYLLQPKFIV